MPSTSQPWPPGKVNRNPTTWLGLRSKTMYFNAIKDHVFLKGFLFQVGHTKTPSVVFFVVFFQNHPKPSRKRTVICFQLLNRTLFFPLLFLKGNLSLVDTCSHFFKQPEKRRKIKITQMEHHRKKGFFPQCRLKSQWQRLDPSCNASGGFVCSSASLLRWRSSPSFPWRAP